MSRKSIPQFVLFLFLCFFFTFPKGGIKIGGVPITWGYLLLLMVSFILIGKYHTKISKYRLVALCCLLPFQLLSFLSITFNGFTHLGYLLSFYLSFFILPICTYVLFSQTLEEIDVTTVTKLLTRCMVFLSLYGIVLFSIKLVFGLFIQIPLLTVNLQDIGLLETEKCIQRGALFKLISTYNNGNLYGICMLMFTPLFYTIEKSFLKRNLLRTSLLLTLSRTVWLGMLIVEVLYFVFMSKKNIRKTLQLTVILCLFFTGVFAIVQKTLDISFFQFFLDTSLGGRLSEEKSLIAPTLLSQKPFLNISEIVYLGMVENFGILGLITFLLGFGAPVVIWLTNISVKPEIAKAIAIGMVGYWMICVSDGCILLIPTLGFYWFLAAFLLKKEPILHLAQTS